MAGWLERADGPDRHEAEASVMNEYMPTSRPTDPVNHQPTPTCNNPVPATPTVEPYSARPSISRLRAKLSQRDLEVLATLGRLRLLTGGQIQRLHMADGSSTTQARRSRAMLQRLTELRLVVRLERRIGGVRSGSSGFVY